MFQDLDSTLAAMLSDPAMPASLAALRNADKSFVTPDKNFAPARATVDLFLYEVRENRQLRETAPIEDRSGAHPLHRLPPLRVDCCYLVTTWSTQAGSVGVAEAHGLLAQALLWLSRTGTIPGAYLQGSLVNQLYPAPTLVAQMDGQKNLGEFWFALGIPPRPAFHLTVTIAMELLLEFTAPIVTTTVTETRRTGVPGSGEIWLQIGGTVLRGVPPRPISGGAAIVLAVNPAGTLVRVDTAAPFRVGDLVRAGAVGRARVTAIAGNSLTLNMPLPGLAVGDTLKANGPRAAWIGLEDAAGTPVQATTTDAGGRFTFIQVSPGNYRLRARAKGLGEIQRAIEIPSPSGDYDLQFP